MRTHKPENRKGGIAATDVCVYSFLCILYAAPGFTQDTPVINRDTIKEVVDTVAIIMDDKYVFPDIGKKMAQYVRKLHKAGAYDSFTEVKPLCSKLTADLRTISNDKHLFVFYSPEEAIEVKASKKMLPADQMKEYERTAAEWYRRQNFGFKKVEILDGNIGYLKIDYFPNINGAETCIGAMSFLAGADAIIIDLRDNGGGEGIGAFLSSYFFTPDKVLLGEVRYRDANRNEGNWTLPYVPGTRRPEVGLYILTSSRTFSAAEGFAYGLKQLKRAMIVGETTKGGAHPIDVLIVKGGILTQVPIGSSYNPITKTNWEGVGVTPDIKVSADDALKAAHADALEKIIKKTTDAEYRKELESALAKLKK